MIEMKLHAYETGVIILTSRTVGVWAIAHSDRQRYPLKMKSWILPILHGYGLNLLNTFIQSRKHGVYGILGRENIPYTPVNISMSKPEPPMVERQHSQPLAYFEKRTSAESLLKGTSSVLIGKGGSFELA